MSKFFIFIYFFYIFYPVHFLLLQLLGKWIATALA